MPVEMMPATSGVVRSENRTPTTSPGSPYVKVDSRDPKVREDRVTKMVLERMAVASRFDQSFKERALLHWMSVQDILPPDFPFYSRYFEPETGNVSEENIQAFMGPIFQKDVVCRVKAMDDQGEQEREMTQLVMDYCLREKIKYKQKLYFQSQENAYFGNGVVRHVVQIVETATSSVKPMIEGGDYGVRIGMQRSSQTIKEPWPQVRNISRFDCYPAPTGATIQEMPYFIERLILPLEYIKYFGKMAGYKNLDKLKGFFVLDRTEGYALGEWSERHFDLMERLSAIGMDVQEGSVVGQDAIKYGELLVYSQAPNYGNGCDRLIIIGDRQWLLWDSAEPRFDMPKGGYPHHHGLKPYSEIKFRPRNGQVWQARGIPEIVYDQQMLLNVNTNTAQDMIAEQRQPMTMVEESAGVEDLSDLVREPGKIVRVARKDGIMDREAPAVTQDIWRNIERTRGNIARLGDTPDYASDQSASLAKGVQTKGGLENLTDQAMQGKTFTSLFSEQGIEDGLNIIMADVQQVIRTPQRMKIAARNKILAKVAQHGFVEIDPMQIQGHYNVTIIGPSRVYSNSQKAALLEQMGEILNSLPTVKKRAKEDEIFKELVELKGVDDVERFLRNDQEQAQYDQEMAQVPHPTPEILKMLVSKMKDMPPDIQTQIEIAAGLRPSEVGGSSNLDKHIADIVKMIMEHDQQFHARNHETLLKHLEPQKPVAPGKMKAFKE